MTEENQIPQNLPEDVANVIALTSKIFNANLAQQNALLHQQMAAQIEMVALAKCLQVLLDADTGDTQVIEGLSTRIAAMFDQLQTRAEERLAASQKQMDELLNEIKTRAAVSQPG